MSEQSIDSFLDKLVRVLLQDIGFYIPKSIFPEQVLEIIQLDYPEHFFDEIFYLDLENGMMFFEINTFGERLMQKPRLLEKNIIELLKKKDECGKVEFDYILEKYFDKLNFYCKMVSLLSSKLAFYFKDSEDVLASGVFELQFNIYKRHLIDLMGRFYKEKEAPIKEYYEFSEIFETYVPDFITRLGLYYKEFDDVASIKLSNPIIEEERMIQEEEILQSDQVPKKRLKKEPLFTDQEIEDFILTTVFNVKLDSK